MTKHDKFLLVLLLLAGAGIGISLPTARVETQGGFRSAGRFQPGTGEVTGKASANPVPGAEISITVPTGEVWRPMAFFATLVTSGTVANREASLIIEDLDDLTNILTRTPTRQNQAASLTRNYSWAPGQLITTPVTDLTLTAPFPSAIMPLQPNFRLRTLTTSMQTGDDWSVGMLLIEKWRVP